MWKKKLKHKRQQFLLIGIVLLFATAIFAGCVSYTLETTAFSKSFFSSDNCTDLFYLARGENMEKYFLEDKGISEDVKTIFYQPAKIIKADMLLDGIKLPKYCTAIIAMEDYHKIPWYMEIADGSKVDFHPRNNEIWVTSVYADDNNIEVGDTITLSGKYIKELKVSSLINTAVCPSGMMGISPLYVNQATLDLLSEQKATYISISIKNGMESAESFKQKIPKEFYSNIVYDLDRAGMEMSFSTASTLFGGIGTIAALVIFIVSIILIRFMLKSTLIREYRSIGIYKAVGFTSTKIKSFYLCCYVFVGIVAIPLGAILGIPISKLLGTITFKYLGDFHFSSVTLLACIISIFLLLFLLIINVLLTLKGINKITPVDALNVGMISSKAKLKKSAIKNAYSPLSTAINDILKRKGMSIMIILVLTVSFYLSLFFSSINYTCSNLENNLDKWFGIPKFDCMIETTITKELTAYLENNPYVRGVTYSNFSTKIKNLRCNNKDIDFTDTAILSFSTFDESKFDFVYTTGRSPHNPNEIGVSIKELKDFGLKAGDYVNLTIGEHTGDYLICGVFPSMSQGGKNIHILNSELDRCNIQYLNKNILINLKNKSSYESFKHELNSKFPSLQLEMTMTSLVSTTKSIMDLAAPITTILVGVFFLFSLLNIINLLLMNNIENRRQFGILKAIGFTNRYICLQSLCRIFLLSGVAALLAQILQKTVSGPFFFMITGVNALESPIALNIAITSALMGIIIFTSLMFALPLKKILPTELMEE
jgi:putative ABC transport system permease protein